MSSKLKVLNTNSHNPKKNIYNIIVTFIIGVLNTLGLLDGLLSIPFSNYLLTKSAVVSINLLTNSLLGSLSSLSFNLMITSLFMNARAPIFKFTVNRKAMT